MMTEKYCFNELNPAEVMLGDSEISKIRFSLINNSIRIQKETINKDVAENLTPVENLTEYKPFSLNEFNGGRKRNMYSIRVPEK